MLLERLINYYGTPDEEQERFINEKTLSMSEEKQDEIAQKIIEERTKRFGFPDIAALKKFFEKEEKKRIYYWAVCLEPDCKTEYAAGLMICPTCYKKGLKFNKYAIKNSEFPPSKKVIMFNQQAYFSSEKDDKLCINCEIAKKEWAFCFHFGNPDWECKTEDFRQCDCKACCLKHKAGNRNIFKK